MAGKTDDAAKGAAVIDLNKVEKQSLPDNLDGLDFGDEEIEDENEVVDDDEVGKTKADDEVGGKKTEKKAEKKAEKKSEKDAESEEAEEEESEEDDAEEDDDTKDKKAEKTEPKMVPQARLMRVKGQRDQLQAQLEAAQDKLKQLTDTATNSKKAEDFEKQLNDLYIELETARAAGNVQESAKLARKLDAMKDDASKRQSAIIAQVETRRQLEARMYDNAVTQLELLVPAINPEHDDFDDELVADLDAATRGFEAQGMAPADALKRAAKRLFGKNVFDDPKIRREKQPEPKKTDIKKNAEAVKKTPPSAVKEERTEKTQEIKVSTLSRDEFAKLPEAAQRRLLGDDV